MTHECPERRRANRLPEENLLCNLGWVMDLSARGLRVCSPRRLQGELVVDLNDGCDEVVLRAEVRWVQRRGCRRYEVGLELLEVRPAQLRALGRIAVNNRRRRGPATQEIDSSGREFGDACRLLVEGFSYPSVGLALL